MKEGRKERRKEGRKERRKEGRKGRTNGSYKRKNRRTHANGRKNKRISESERVSEGMCSLSHTTIFFTQSNRCT